MRVTNWLVAVKSERSSLTIRSAIYLLVSHAIIALMAPFSRIVIASAIVAPAFTPQQKILQPPAPSCAHPTACVLSAGCLLVASVRVSLGRA